MTRFGTTLRRVYLGVLREGPMSVTGLACRLRLPRSVVSNHLMTLRKMELLDGLNRPTSLRLSDALLKPSPEKVAAPVVSVEDVLRAAEEPMTTREIAVATGMSGSGVRHHLRALEQARRTRRIGRGAATCWVWRRQVAA